jgi:hypothetical protein
MRKSIQNEQIFYDEIYRYVDMLSRISIDDKTKVDYYNIVTPIIDTILFNIEQMKHLINLCDEVE